MPEDNSTELAHLDDWESMIHFALNLLTTSTLHIGTGIFGERIIITQLDHANELLMKAFLIKHGYVINYLEKSDVAKGVKKEQVLDKTKTIDYIECLKIVSREVHLSAIKEEKIKEFHRLRNEIQHRSTNIPLDKREAIRNFYPYLKELYELMFPELNNSFPEIEF